MVWSTKYLAVTVAVFPVGEVWGAKTVRNTPNIFLKILPPPPHHQQALVEQPADLHANRAADTKQRN